MINDIRRYGFRNRAVLDAMKHTPRHHFISKSFSPDVAYGDHPLQIGQGQTISQPYTVAFMLDLLYIRKGQNIMEIGTGSGWNAALIKYLTGEEGRVVSLEILPEIARRAHERLRDLGIDVHVVNGDGSKGFPKNAPYDRIIVTCAPSEIMNSWEKQLKLGGILVVPVGMGLQTMMKGTRRKSGLKVTRCGSFRFVPLLSAGDLF
jgi:protein-L-isoaspartate(D-aspartate) O-methyltransferase